MFGHSFGIPGQIQTNQPSTGPLPGNHTNLSPWNHSRAIAGGAPYTYVPAVPPVIQMIEGCRYQVVTRSVIVSTVAAMTSATTEQFKQFNPGTIIAWTGDGYKTDLTDLPVGRTPLNCFKVRFYFTAGTTTAINVTNLGGSAPVLASTLLGSGALPAYQPGAGIRVEQGWQLSVDIQILVANFEATITLYTLEEYPPGA